MGSAVLKGPTTDHKVSRDHGGNESKKCFMEHNATGHLRLNEAIFKFCIGTQSDAKLDAVPLYSEFDTNVKATAHDHKSVYAS